MTIYLDVSAAVNSRAGLGRYTRSLADALIAELEIPPTLFYNRTSEATVPPNWRNLPQRAFRMGYKPWRMLVWQGQLLRMDFSRLVPGAAIFHATEHLLLPLRGVPTVLTIHDLIFKLFPEHHKKLNYYFLNAAVPLFVRRADAIIAVSQATKNDLMRHYGTPDNKITVVHEAAAPHFRVVPSGGVARPRQVRPAGALPAHSRHDRARKNLTAGEPRPPAQSRPPALHGRRRLEGLDVRRVFRQD